MDEHPELCMITEYWHFNPTHHTELCVMNCMETKRKPMEEKKNTPDI